MCGNSVRLFCQRWLFCYCLYFVFLCCSSCKLDFYHLKQAEQNTTWPMVSLCYCLRTSGYIIVFTGTSLGSTLYELEDLYTFFKCKLVRDQFVWRWICFHFLFSCCNRKLFSLQVWFKLNTKIIQQPQWQFIIAWALLGLSLFFWKETKKDSYRRLLLLRHSCVIHIFFCWHETWRSERTFSNWRGKIVKAIIFRRVGNIAIKKKKGPFYSQYWQK